MLELAADVRGDVEWDDWEESTVRTVIVEDRRQPSKPDAGYAGVAHAALTKLSPGQLLIVALVIALGAVAVAGRKLGVW